MILAVPTIYYYVKVSKNGMKMGPHSGKNQLPDCLAKVVAFAPYAKGGPQMNVITTAISDSRQLKGQINAIIACDVSKDTINLVATLGKHLFECQFDNHTEIIENELRHIKTVAKKCNCNKASLLCDSDHLS